MCGLDGKLKLSANTPRRKKETRSEQPYTMIEGNSTYETTVIPRALIGQIIRMAHDELGHNGTHRTYTMLKRLYYWKCLEPSVEKHIKTCYQCQRRNK